MQPYQYPHAPHEHLHGPGGYTTYESYRDWLRDEYLYRCVYCLHREKWGRRRGQWHIDHLLSQEDHPELVVTYENLIYSCAGCNLAKGNTSVPDPCSCMLHSAVEVFENGEIEGKTPEARRTIKILGLDGPEDIEFRSLLIGIYRLKEYDYEQFVRWMGYPTYLPDLTKKRCPTNSRPEGLQDSAHALRARGQLPDYY